jgi:hypothetical protein
MLTQCNYFLKFLKHLLQSRTTCFLHQHGRDKPDRKRVLSHFGLHSISSKKKFVALLLSPFFLPLSLQLNWSGVHWHQNGGIQTFVTSLHQTIKTGKQPKQNNYQVYTTLQLSHWSKLVGPCQKWVIVWDSNRKISHINFEGLYNAALSAPNPSSTI